MAWWKWRACYNWNHWVGDSNNGICLVQPQLKGIEYMCFKGAMGSAGELAQCGFNCVRRERERRFVKRNNFLKMLMKIEFIDKEFDVGCM